MNKGSTSNLYKLLLILASIMLMLGSCGGNNTIVLGATTTLEDSGILAKLINAFEREHPLTVKPLISGSGQIHQLIKRGDIDTAITHDPAGEAQLLNDNIITARWPLMRNDFVIVGPAKDPAGVKQALTPEAVFRSINGVAALYVSRNDSSGTHQMEKKWWWQAEISPPETHLIKTGSGMGATLAVAAERSAYTLVDRGTWLNFSNKKTLKILFEHADLLPNIYSILSFGNNRAEIWEQWLQSDTARQLILNHRIDQKPVFFQ